MARRHRWICSSSQFSFFWSTVNCSIYTRAYASTRLGVLVEQLRQLLHHRCLRRTYCVSHVSAMHAEMQLLFCTRPVFQALRHCSL